jgi:hypothetical protein
MLAGGHIPPHMELVTRYQGTKGEDYYGNLHTVYDKPGLVNEQATGFSAASFIIPAVIQSYRKVTLPPRHQGHQDGY